MRYFILLFFLMCNSWAYAEISLEINENSILGLSWDSKPKDFIDLLGKPSGTVTIKDQGVYYLFGPNFGVYFDKEEKLKKVEICVVPLIEYTYLSQNIKLNASKILVGGIYKLRLDFNDLQKKLDEKVKEPQIIPPKNLSNKIIDLEFKDDRKCFSGSIYINKIIISKEIEK